VTPLQNTPSNALDTTTYPKIRTRLLDMQTTDPNRVCLCSDCDLRHERRKRIPPTDEERLAIVKKHFTQADLEFVEGKIVTPLVGAPWLRTFDGCKQRKRVVVGDYVLRLRAYHPHPIKYNRTEWEVQWAPIEDTTHFISFLPKFDKNFKLQPRIHRWTFRCGCGCGKTRKFIPYSGPNN